MKNICRIITVTIQGLLISATIWGQSPRVLDNISKNCLAPFEYDGKVKLASLESGEETELYRSFEKGKTYKILVLNMRTNEALNFTVYDDSNKVIYVNTDTNRCGSWVYEPDKAMYLKIVIRPPQNNPESDVVFVVGSKKKKR